MLAAAFGVVFLAWIAWSAYSYATPEVRHSPDGRPYVCNPTLKADELAEALAEPVAERGQTGNCAFIDRFQR